MLDCNRSYLFFRDAHAEAGTGLGKFGHLTICDLAYRNLTPTSRNALNGLLRSGQGGITVQGRGRMPERRYTSFNVGCLEEDEIPRQHENDHFLNVPRPQSGARSGLHRTGKRRPATLTMARLGAAIGHAGEAAAARPMVCGSYDSGGSR